MEIFDMPEFEALIELPQEKGIINIDELIAGMKKPYRETQERRTTGILSLQVYCRHRVTKVLQR
jgi:hypothetical protein